MVADGVRVNVGVMVAGVGYRASERKDLLVVTRGVDPVREQDHEQILLGIDPGPRAVGAEELPDVVAREPERQLRQVVGAEREELRLAGDLVGRCRAAGDLDHRADQVLDLDALLVHDLPGDAIDDQEHDLAVLRRLLDEPNPDAVKGHAHYLLKLNECLRRSVIDRWARGERRWSVSDGLTRVTPQIGAALDAQRLTRRPFSLSALQRFSACPYQFLLAAVYRLQPLELPEPLDRHLPKTTEDSFPGFLLNVTNDAWFGRTPGPYQHFHQARVRAVEEGLPLVRAANSGISAVTDSAGRLLAQSALGPPAVIDSALPLAGPQPPAARLGRILAFTILISFTGIAASRLFT